MIMITRYTKCDELTDLPSALRDDLRIQQPLCDLSMLRPLTNNFIALNIASIIDRA